MRAYLKLKYKIIIDRTSDAIQIKIIRQLQQFYIRAESSDQIKKIDI
jgi:hypothetical protein